MGWREEYGEEVKALINAVYSLLDLHDFTQIKECLLGSRLPNAPKEMKEQIIFLETMVAVTVLNRGEDLLHYLIFDYKIPHETIIKVKKVENDFLRFDRAEELFELRRAREELHSKLSQELAPHNEKPSNNRPKI